MQKCTIKSNHVTNASSMIGDTLVKFDADGVSEGVSPAVARAAIGVPGFEIIAGDLTARPEEKLEGVVNLTIEVTDADGSPRGKFTKTGKVCDLFPDGNGVMAVKLEAVKPTKDDKAKPNATATDNSK